jgi:hypothetical protein
MATTFTSFYSRNCLRKWYLSPYSRFYSIMNIVHLIFIIYSAISIPLQVSFGLEMEGAILVLELISILETCAYIFLNMRTVVVSKGGISFYFNDIMTNYKENGFYTDLLGLNPLNMALGLLNINSPLYIVTPLRMLRMFMVIKLPKITSQLERAKRGFSFFIQVIKSAVAFYFLWHWTASAWFYLNKYVEGDGVNTWIQDQNLNQQKLSQQYLMSVYYIINIVTSVGYGDMFPMTNIERLFTCFLINTGLIF